MEEAKTYWVISTNQGKLIHDDKKIMFFSTAHEARMYIEDHLGNSAYLRLRRWKK
jgi:hypothetical protein